MTVLELNKFASNGGLASVVRPDWMHHTFIPSTFDDNKSFHNPVSLSISCLFKDAVRKIGIQKKKKKRMIRRWRSEAE